MSGTVFNVNLNSTNLISSTYNNQYRFTPPSGAFVFKKGSKITVASISLFYSWFNFSNNYNNNSFSIIFPTFGTLAVDIGNQSLDIPSLNSYCQQLMIANNLYLVNANSQNVYYFEIIENSSLYAVQVNLYPIPSSLPAGWTNPGLPLSGYCPQFVVPNTSFQNIIGFTAGTYGSASSAVIESYTSSFTPQVSPVESCLVGCSFLKNYFNSNPTILYSFSPAGTTFGDLISTAPTFPQFVSIFEGIYSYVDIFFYDQNGNPLPINDTNLSISLLVELAD